MDVRMEYTEGVGKIAEVWVQGNLLCVCDGVSTGEQRCPPGEMPPVKFSYVSEAGLSWDQAMRGNLSERCVLDPVRRWSYAGFGRIVQGGHFLSDVVFSGIAVFAVIWVLATYVFRLDESRDQAATSEEGRAAI